MTLFFRRRVPDLRRIVLVESGDRQLFEKILPFFYKQCSEVDLVTCYGGVPENFRGGQVFHIGEYAGAHKRLVAELRARHYSAIGIVCADQPIMTKWKWLLAARVPAKLFIINENGDFFWVDYAHWGNMLRLALVRAGLTGGEAISTVGRILALPFALIFLLLYAGWMHLRRALLVKAS